MNDNLILLNNFQWLNRFFRGVQGKDILEKLDEMTNFLDSFENKIFGEWADTIPEIITNNMMKSLLLRTEKGMLELNFDDTLVAVHKEVKMLNSIEKQGVPEVALEFYSLSDSLWVRIYYQFFYK